MAPKRHGRIRIYRTPDLERLRLIKQLRAFDVPIARIRELLKDQDSPSLSGNISSFARELLAKHLEELQMRYSQIHGHILELRAMLGKTDEASYPSNETSEPALTFAMANAAE